MGAVCHVYVKRVRILASHSLTAVQGRELSENSRQLQISVLYIHIVYIYTSTSYACKNHSPLFQCVSSDEEVVSNIQNYQDSRSYNLLGQFDRQKGKSLKLPWLHSSRSALSLTEFLQASKLCKLFHIIMATIEHMLKLLQ